MNELTPFDYATLGPTAESVRMIAKSIASRIRTTAGAIIAIGRELRSAKGILGAEVFGQWVAAEFGFSERTVRNYVAVANQLGEYEDRIGSIPASTLYLLASQSVPQEAIETVIARTEAGETVGRDEAKEIIADSLDYVPTESPDEEEADDPQEDEPVNTTATVAAPRPSKPKPNASPLWGEAGRCIERALEIYRKHAQECDEAADVITDLERSQERHDYYVRGIETV
jgi:hypothetical protein